MPPNPDPLDPVALDGSPAQAFASHRARAIGIARHFVKTRPLSNVRGKADENHTVALIGHFHVVSDNPGFQSDGVPSATEAPLALRRLEMGNGLVGTTGASTERDYDMALKGLVVLAYRYGHLLDAGIPADQPRGVDFILNNLVPASLSGGHPREIEIVEQSFLNIDTPETENHLLMIESSRYLFNQLRFDRRPQDATFNNDAHRLGEWLLGYMQRIAKHDYLEFNSSPYQRLALHALLNLHEFARNAEVRTGAQILLDYTMMKFALSSNRSRRVAPFRRQQHRIAHTANQRNYLYSPDADQVNGFFLAYAGLGGPDPAGIPVQLPGAHDFAELLAATAAYRPPPAAYALGIARDNKASFHRFYHGTRPSLPSAESEAIDGGLELYYHSPSFLLSAGGQFLNSGYGHDEIDIGKQAWEQTSRAQAATLIPTRADALFHDLIRFEPYPDPLVDPYADDREDPDCYHTIGVNIGVGRGLIAGANLRPAEKKTVLENATSAAPALALHTKRDNFKMLLVSWKGSGNSALNVARVQGTNVMGLEGVEGIDWKAVLNETTDTAPAIASNAGNVYVAWRGSGNNQLNIAISRDDGLTFQKAVLPESSELPPALTSHHGKLYLAWTGRGNDKVNVARLIPLGNTAGGFDIEFETKVVLGESSGAAPALASNGERLYVGWKGSGNDALNLIYSEDDGVSFRGKATFGENSSHGPALASHEGTLFMGWKGSGNEQLNVARVILLGNTAGVFRLVLENKVVLPEISEQPPALGSWGGMLFVAWKGEGADLLNFRVSRDGSFRSPDRWIFKDLSHLGMYIAAYRVPVSRPDDLDPIPDNLGFVYAVEKSDMDARQIDFRAFESLTRARNAQLPPTLDYGGFYQFHAPDDRNFSIWFQLSGQKYQARVVDLGAPLGDLATLPLVSGEYMTSPGGGHDGLIEIRQPGGEAVPLVLDYRDARRPKRTENKAAFAKPWIDRTLALFSLAPRLGQLEQPRDMYAALADGALLYDEMLRLNTDRHGPVLAPAVLSGLALIGVDFSVPREELLEWLSNPEFTPYPATAQALLLLRRRLKAPVFLDVISFNYDTAAGMSPRVVTEVKPDVLKRAILEGFNVRYGTAASTFEEILNPI